MRGIKRSDLHKQDGKLWLKCDSPNDYVKHIMYLFSNDYIEITSKNGSIKFTGYYISVKDINTNRLYLASGVKPSDKNNIVIAISGTDKVQKYNIDILGKIKCGEPLSYLKARK